MFDPLVFETGKQTGRIDIQVANVVGFFIEGMQGNDLIGRIVPMTGLLRGTGGGPGAGRARSFVRSASSGSRLRGRRRPATSRSDRCCLGSRSAPC